MAREFQKNSISIAGILTGIFIFTLMLLIPAELMHLTPEAKKAIAVGLLMIVLWVTEAIPIPVTSLLPIVLFPILGVLKLDEALRPYSNPVIMLFFGGFVIALALEKYNIHRRVALNLVNRTGTSPGRVIAGFMIATGFLSMWISNTSTAVIMFPIGMSIIGIVEKQYGAESPLLRKFGLALMLGIAYAANIGGSGTLVGTPSNAILVGMLRQRYDIRLDFAHWMIIGIPLIIILTVLAWITLTKIFFRLNDKPLPAVGEYVKQEVHKLGRPDRSEKRVLLVFAVTAFFWVFRAHLNRLIGTTVLSDSLIATGAAILMFVVPSGTGKKEALLSWPDAVNIPWGILILFGGGLSLASGLYSSGVIDIIGQSILRFSDVPPLIIMAVTVSIMLILTELISGTALSSVLLPVIFGVSEGLHLSPLELAVPLVLVANGAFMMPMGTPPNAIVFASGYLKIKDMMRTGWLMNIFSIIIVILLSQWLLKYLI